MLGGNSFSKIIDPLSIFIKIFKSFFSAMKQDASKKWVIRYDD